MGALFSFFKAKKPEPTDYAQILEKIAADIEEHKKTKAAFISSHRRAIAQLLIVFCVVELLLVVWYYFHQKPTEIFDHLLHILPVFLVPILVFQLKKLISFYYNKRIERCDERIQDLIEQQQEKVAELKRITNFDVVSTLLNRYDPETKRRQAAVQQPKPTPQPKATPQPKPTPRPQYPPQPLHPPQPAVPPTPTPALPREAPTPVPTPCHIVTQTPQRTPTYVMPVPKLHNPTPLPPAPATGQRKGLIDKMVDFLVGDGPEYSVAVTCKRCGAYYANLPKEEVPFTRFTCHNCGSYNEEEGAKQGSKEKGDETEKEKEDKGADVQEMENRTSEETKEAVGEETEKEGEQDRPINREEENRANEIEKITDGEE